MNITRLTEISLYYHIQNALARDRVKEQAMSDDYKTYKLRGKNIIPNKPVEVYLNDTLMDDAVYSVDCNNGLIILNNSVSPSDKVFVTYSHCPVNMYDEGINPLGSDFKMPAVAITEDEKEMRAYELGNPKKESISTWIIEVWSERGGERNDITDAIVNALEEDLRVLNYNKGFPVDKDGSINKSFDYNDVVAVAYVDSINYSKSRSLDIGDKPVYYSVIILDLNMPAI